MIDKHQRLKHVALRSVKAARFFRYVVAVAAIFILIKYAHMA